MPRKSARLNSWIWLWQQSFFLTDRWASDTTPSKSAAWQSDLTAIFRPNILLVPGTTSTWQEEKWFKEIRKEKDLALYSAIHFTVKGQKKGSLCASSLYRLLHNTYACQTADYETVKCQKQIRNHLTVRLICHFSFTSFMPPDIVSILSGTGGRFVTFLTRLEPILPKSFQWVTNVMFLMQKCVHQVLFL